MAIDKAQLMTAPDGEQAILGYVGAVKAGTNITIDPDGTINAYGGPGTGDIIILDNISGQFDGTRTTFGLTYQGVPIPNTETAARIMLNLGGILQAPDESYTVVDSVCTFSAAPAAGISFSARAFKSATPGFQVGAIEGIQILDDISAQFNGANNNFELRVGGQPVSPDISSLNFFLSVGGVLQNPISSYTIAGSNVVFSEAPLGGAEFSGRLFTLTTLQSQAALLNP
jgi:hypothetical protein